MSQPIEGRTEPAPKPLRLTGMSQGSQPQARFSVVASFPAHAFPENLAVCRNDSVLVTAVAPKTLYYVPPPRREAEVEPVVLHRFDEHATGIAELAPDVFAVFTTNAYTSHETYLHRLDLRAWAPGMPAEPELLLTFPDAVLAVNGCCAIGSATILAADSFAGAIWRVDLPPDGAPGARVWLRHRSMAHVPDTLPPPPQPGVNGLRYSAGTRHVYYTTTGQKLFMRVPVDPVSLEPAGEPERVAGGGMYDDFCIDDLRGFAYVTVHRENRIDRISLEPGDGPPRAIAGSPPGDRLLGPSSAAWSRAPGAHRHVAYVTTDGGRTAPPPDGIVRNARLLRMELA